MTLADTTFPLDDPLWVLATQNPVEQEGVYTLPEAQLDRFSMMLRVGYPTEREEVDMLHLRMTEMTIERRVSPADVTVLREFIRASVFVDDKIIEYLDLVDDKILQGEGQTAIGDGLTLANQLLARETKTGGRGHQVIVLFTDGENNRGRDPVEALAESHDANIRVHVVGVDIEQRVRQKPAVQALLEAIRRNGGRYFDASSERDLVAASRAIDSVEKGLLVSKVYVRDVPVYEWFAVPALVLLVAAMALTTVPYFIDQT